MGREKKMIKFFPVLLRVVALLIVILLIGCTGTIGPFTKNVYVDQEKRLVVEKCLIEWNNFTGTLGVKECTTEKFKLLN